MKAVIKIHNLEQFGFGKSITSLGDATVTLMEETAEQRDRLLQINEWLDEIDQNVGNGLGCTVLCSPWFAIAVWVCLMAMVEYYLVALKEPVVWT